MQQRQKPTPNLNYNLNERNHTRYYTIMRAGNTHPRRTVDIIKQQGGGCNMWHVATVHPMYAQRTQCL